MLIKEVNEQCHDIWTLQKNKSNLIGEKKRSKKKSKNENDGKHYNLYEDIVNWCLLTFSFVSL